MAAKPETRYYTRVNKELKKSYPQIYAEKMSNPYRGGTPDVYYEGPGGILWVEYKWDPKSYGLIRLFDTARKPSLSKLQQAWLERAHDNDVPTAVILGSPMGGIYLWGMQWQSEITPTAQCWRPILTIAAMVGNRLI